MMRHLPLAAWFCWLWIAPVSYGQLITIRVINAENGHPLTKKHIMVVLLAEKGEKRRPHLQLKTDVHGEARFMFPEPASLRFAVLVRLSSLHWSCRCSAVVTTAVAVQAGIVEGKKSISAATPVKAEPGQIVFVVRRRPFFEQLRDILLAPLME